MALIVQLPCRWEHPLWSTQLPCLPLRWLPGESQWPSLTRKPPQPPTDSGFIFQDPVGQHFLKPLLLMKLKGFLNCPVERGEDCVVHNQGTNRRRGFVDDKLNFGKPKNTLWAPRGQSVKGLGIKTPTANVFSLERLMDCQVLPSYLISTEIWVFWICCSWSVTGREKFVLKLLEKKVIIQNVCLYLGQK